jgi:hypothetical protein
MDMETYARIRHDITKFQVLRIPGPPELSGSAYYKALDEPVRKWDFVAGKKLVRTQNYFLSRLANIIRPGPFNLLEIKNRERQNGSYRNDFDIRIDNCSCRNIQRLGHIPVDTDLWVDFSFIV